MRRVYLHKNRLAFYISQTKALLSLVCLDLYQKILKMWQPSSPKVRKRKRRLSLPLDYSWLGQLERAVSDTKKPSLQEQSPLMRLPAELRILIYQHVVCEEQDGKLQMVYNRIDECTRVVPWQTWENEGGFWGAGVMGLLCSCRVLYTESIPYLYSTPTFHFRDVYAFFAFACTIPPPRLSQIRHLRLAFGPPRNWAWLKYPLNYKPIIHVKALSPLPKPTTAEEKSAGWAVEQLLKRMTGLKRDVFAEDDVPGMFLAVVERLGSV